VNLSRFYAIGQIEYCRNFIFKRQFPIHKIFERSCEIGLWRLTANRISEIFGVRLNKRLRGKLATVIDQIEHGHHVFRAYGKLPSSDNTKSTPAICATNSVPTICSTSALRRGLTTSTLCARDSRSSPIASPPSRPSL
jgi:hypothetical protein